MRPLTPAAARAYVRVSRRMARRLLLYVLGMNVMAAGIVLSTRAGLGVAAISSAAYAWSQFLGLSFGTANILLYAVFISAEALLLRAFPPSLLLQIPMALFAGLSSDLFDFLLPAGPDAFAAELPCLLLANITTGVGVYAMTKANLILDPGNAVVATLCTVLRKPFSYLRIRFDASLVLFTAASGLLFAGHIIGIGLGTVISAWLIGRSVGAAAQLADRPLGRWLRP